MHNEKRALLMKINQYFLLPYLPKHIYLNKGEDIG